MKGVYNMEVGKVVKECIDIIDRFVKVEEFELLECVDRDNIEIVYNLLKVVAVRLERENIEL